MATRLVDRYGLDFAALLAEKLEDALAGFDSAAFIGHMAKQLGSESLLARQDLYVDALEQFLGRDFQFNLDLFSRIWGEELQQETGMFSFGWWLWPLGRYVERHGASWPEISYPFIKEFTKRQTGEFMIRPLLVKHTRLTMEQMLSWSLDESVHVRRLASEGLRIALPWAKKTTAALTEFPLYTAILTSLKDDPSRFVQKSVGNNLNDLYKHDRTLAEQVIFAWEHGELSKAAGWIIRHGRRSLKTKPVREPI